MVYYTVSEIVPSHLRLFQFKILVFHCTDTHIYVFPVDLTLSVVQNKYIFVSCQTKLRVPSLDHVNHFFVLEKYKLHGMFLLLEHQSSVPVGHTKQWFIVFHQVDQDDFINCHSIPWM